MRYYCDCEEKTITCAKGRCPTFTILGITNKIIHIDFESLLFWDYDILDSLSLALYDEPEFGEDFLPKLTIHCFYKGFEDYINNPQNYDFLTNRVLKDKFNYIEEKLTDILKERIGCVDKDEVSVSIPYFGTNENMEYKINFNSRTISHNDIKSEDRKGRYYTKYESDVKNIEYFFTDDPSIRLGCGSRTNTIRISRVITPIHIFSLNDYIYEP